MGKYVHSGLTIDYVNAGSADIKAGDAVVIGSLFTVAATPIAVGNKGCCYTQGTFRLPIASTTTANQGAVAYWDSSNNVVVTSGTTPIGYFATASVSGETTATILVGYFVTISASGTSAS